MGTAGGEPGVLLNALKPMLGVVGDIKTPHEVFRVVGMMKDAEKLMSRCVYLNILKATCRQAADNAAKRETLDKFLTSGGWAILNKWLMEFTKAENYPVLLELIEVLKLMPVTVELLKQGNTGKIMKSMTKLAHSDVKKNASVMIKRWKTMIRDQQDTKKKQENESSDLKNGKDSKDVVSETSGFMDALNISAAAIPPAKKKRRNSVESTPRKTTLPLDEILKAPMPGEIKKPEPEPEPEPMESVESDAGPYVFHNPAVEAANLALAEDKTTGVLIDEGSLARRKNRKKRNITWAPDEDLVEISYYELQEGERKEDHAQSFSEARQHELMLEKQALRHARGLGPDNMTEKIEWKCLIPVDNCSIPNFVPGEKSREKFIQAEREKTVLAYIFLSKQSLPDFPSEPDFNAEEHNKTSRQPTLIPHDEEQTILPPAKQTVAQPAPTTNTPNVMTSQTLPQVPSSQVPAANASPDNVQNIMAQLMKNNMLPQPPQPPQPPPPQQQQQQQPQQNNGGARPPIPPRNMAPPPPGGPGILRPPLGMRPPFPTNVPPPNMAPMNNTPTNGFRPPPARPALMDAPPPPHNPDIRFQNGRGGFNPRGGYANGRGGPGGAPPRHWNGGPPPPPPPPPKNNNNTHNGNWDDPKFPLKKNFRDENFNEEFNDSHDTYNDEYRNDGRRFVGSGEDRGRGRGFWQRGNNRPHRGRGRGGQRNDYINRDNNRDNRGNYGAKDWNGYDENRNNRRNNEWNNRDDGYNGNGIGPIRGRHHRADGRDRPIRDERAR